MNTEQLKTKLQTLDIFSGSIDLKFFEGFMSNDSYLASDDNNKYVVKIGGNREHYGVVNSHEVEASKAGYRAGISPKVIYNDDSILIFQYIDSNEITFEGIREKETLKRIVSLIKIIQKKVVNYLEGPNLSIGLFQTIKNKITILKERNTSYADKFNNFVKDCEIFERKYESHEIVFAHNDFYFKNILDDGKKLWLVDWEFSGFNPLLLDLANLSRSNELSEEEDDFILEEYFGGTVTKASKYKFQELKCASILKGLLWGMISEIFSEKVFDYKSYTDRMYARYIEQLDYFKKIYVKN